MNVLLIGEPVTVASRLASALRGHAHEVSLHTGDLAGAAATRAADAGQDAVIYLGVARTPDAAAIERVVLDAVASGLDGSDARFVYTSAAEIVGNTKGAIFDEREEIDPGKRFAWRAEHETLVLTAFRNAVTLRPAPIVHAPDDFGPLVEAMWAVAHAERLVPYVLHGNHRWSTVHADDLAEAYVGALERAPAGTTLFVASRELVTMRDCAQAIADAAGDDVETVSITLEDGRVRFGVLADLSLVDIMVSGDRAREELAWRPAARPLLTAIRDRDIDIM